MNAELVKVKMDEAQWVVLGTLMGGILGTKEAIDLGQEINSSGGLELFPDAWSNELWRRAKAALSDRKPPNAYLTIKQVEDLPMDILARLGESAVPAQMVHDVYLPELVQAVQRRKLRQALLEGMESDDFRKAAMLLRSFQPTTFKEPTKPETANEIISEWERAVENRGQISGITTGLDALDRLTWGWQDQQLIVIGARPSQGKTALLVGFARASAMANVPTLYVTMESSQKELTKRFICQMAQVNQMDLRGGVVGERDMEKIGMAFGEFKKRPIWIADLTGKSIATIQACVRRIVESYGIKIVLVDYLQKIKPDERHEKRTYEVAQTSEGLKILAKELNLPVITAAQLNREPDKNKGRPPMLSDLADSGQIERDADLVGLIYRKVNDAGKAEFSLLVSKFRDGPTGSVPLEYCAGYARFDSVKQFDNEPPRNPNND